MPHRKSNVLTVQAWPRLTDGKLYRGKVKGVRVDRTHASRRLHVVIENLDPDHQRGRVHELDLLLPIHPGSRTALFLLACGIDATTIGTTICLDGVANAVVGMRFRGLGPDGSEEFDFEPLPNPPAAKSAATEGSGSKDTAVHLEDDQIPA
jgi:hypothetical protein